MTRSPERAWTASTTPGIGAVISVPASASTEQDELLGILGPLKPEIVEVDSTHDSNAATGRLSSGSTAGQVLARPAGQATIG